MNRRGIYGTGLRLIRDARFKSQAETAAAMELHVDALGLIERKQRDLMLEKFHLAAIYLRFDPAAFMRLTSEDPAKVLACLLPDEAAEQPEGKEHAGQPGAQPRAQGQPPPTDRSGR